MFSFFGTGGAVGGGAGELLSGPRSFNTQYRCYSVSMLPGNERNELEWGGKIILPPSALDQLTRLNIVYPMLFKLSNDEGGRETHAGVLEFVADEGKVYLPYWMMTQNLMLGEGGILRVESASLPVATFSKFQPHSLDFLELSNPKAVLESRLRNFACLSAGDVIAIQYNDRTYEMSVLETKPANAVSIIECDMNVDFAPPVGYQEPDSIADSKGAYNDDDFDMDDLIPEPTGFIAFGGSGNRLDGKKKKATPEQEKNIIKQAEREYIRGIPDYDYEIGFLKFIRNAKPKKIENGATVADGFKAFEGKGSALRSSNAKN